MIVLEFHVILLIICDCRASIVELRNAKNRAQGGPVREPIKTGKATTALVTHMICHISIGLYREFDAYYAEISLISAL